MPTRFRAIGRNAMTIRDEDGFELVKHEPALGRSTWQKYDGEKLIVRTDYDVTHTMNANAEARADAGVTWKGDWHRVGSIPLNVFYDQVAQAHNEGDTKYVKRWLNNSDNRAWRTKEGTL